MSESTHIVFVLDESGSMSSKKDDVIGSVDKFLKEQKEAEGEATMTFIPFSTVPRIEYRSQDIKTIPEFTYNPNGMTALLDAVGLAINTTKQAFKEKCSDCSPKKVLFVVITDGFENVSKEFTRQQIGEMIHKAEQEDKWQFIYLGANQDAWGEAQKFGMSNYQNVATFHMDNFKGIMDNVSHSVMCYRAVDSTQVGSNMNVYKEAPKKDESAD